MCVCECAGVCLRAHTHVAVGYEMKSMTCTDVQTNATLRGEKDRDGMTEGVLESLT